MTFGEWPTYLMHSCDNPLCVNPDHLSEGDHALNMADMAVKGRARNSNKTHCKRGHAYDEVGVRMGTRGNGKQFRICKRCDLEATWKRRGPVKEGSPGPERGLTT